MPTLRFVLGRAGTGKTHYCLNQMRERLLANPSGHPLILLAPEQATFQLEQALAKSPGLEGFFRAHILSFRRLAYRLFDELGGRTIPPTGNLKRLLILKSILARRQKDLQFFGGSARTVGFAQAIDTTLTELRRYGFAPDAIGPDASTSQSHLARKLHDLSLIEHEYRNTINHRFFDPEDYLDRFAALVEHSEFLTGAEIWIDGFADFTALERRALISLIKVSRSAEMALCLDPATLAQSSTLYDQSTSSTPSYKSSPRPFATCEKTYWRITREAREQGIEILSDLPLSQTRRFETSPALASIERHFFSRTHPAKTPATSSIRVIRAQSLQSEIEFVALEALRLARTVPYREMAIVTRDLEQCHDLLRAVLQKLRIPFFMDTQREILHHPLAQCLMAAADVLAFDWRTKDVLQALKSGLFAISSDDADRLENHALAHGLDRAHWHEKKAWHDLAPICEKAIAPLKQFTDDCGTSNYIQAATFAAALKKLMERLDVTTRLEQWAQQCQDAGDLEEAAEHRQVSEAIDGLLDEWTEGLGDSSFSLRDCADLLTEGLAALKLRLSPPTLDHLLVGSIERSRHPNLRVIFLLGMNEGRFPKRPSEDPLLNDNDRATLAAEGIELAPGARDRLLNEPYLAYIAFSRPSEQLIITWSHSDEKCRPQEKSPYLERVMEIVQVEEEDAAESIRGIDAIVDLPSLGSHVARALGQCLQQEIEPEAIWPALHDLGRRRDDKQRSFGKRVEGLFYLNPTHLDQTLAEALYRERISKGISVTSLETYGTCPFRFLAKQGLRLEPRREFQLGVMDRGELMHKVLAALFERLHERNLNWCDAEESELNAWLDESLEEAAAELRSASLDQTGRNRFMRSFLLDSMQKRVKAIREESQVSRFKQYAAELSFGRKDSRWPVLELQLQDGFVVRLHGIIDRLDTCETANGTIARIIDFKAGGLKYDPILSREGIQLQLPIYLLATIRNAPQENWRGAGFFYSPIFPQSEGYQKLTDETDLPTADALLDKFKGCGLFDEQCRNEMDIGVAGEGYSRFWSIKVNRDGSLSANSDGASGAELNAVLKSAESCVVRLATEIASGSCAIHPYKQNNRCACTYCEYKCLCRFEQTTWREIESMPRRRQLEIILRENEE